MTDCELVRRMQQGDMQAFDTLYERYKDDAYRLACLITGSRTDGEDLAQEAFVACAQSIGSLRDGAKFRPWLLRTLSRAAWKYCRKARRRKHGRKRAFRRAAHRGAAPAVCRAPHAR